MKTTLFACLLFIASIATAQDYTSTRARGGLIDTSLTKADNITTKQYNILDPPFNVVANGTTDNAVAFQAALDSAGSKTFLGLQSGAQIEVPAGNYLWASTLRLTGGNIGFHFAKGGGSVVRH